ncbi:MAG: peptidase M14, partial [Rhodanobacter sp.]
LMLAQINNDPTALLAATAKADADTIARAGDATATVPLTFKGDPTSTPYTLKGFAFTLTHSDISNSQWIHYDPSQPKTYTIPNWNGLLPDVSITPPAAYVVPRQWTQIIDKLDAHGIAYRRTSAPMTIRASGYQLDDPRWADKSFEGHLMLRDFKLQTASREVTLPAGSVIVPMDQRAANVAINLLEPQAPDSLLQWGYLNAMFEAKEYGEPRVLEKLAREMMAKDPTLKTAFEQKLHDDPAFAANSYARLHWFFLRSPWYAAQAVGAYPVLRVDAAQLQALSTQPAAAHP